VIALLLSAGLALAASLLCTRYLIDWLQRHRIGQPIHEDVPEGHKVKAGKPTMGGVGIVVAAVIGYVVAHVRSGLVFTRSGLLVLALIVGAGVVGLLDDWIKVSQERNLGLSKRAKSLGLLSVAIGFVVLSVTFTKVHTQLSFTRFDFFDLDLHSVGWSLWGVLMILAVTNGVNLTDGLDGLAAGSSLFAFIAYVVIGFWAFRNPGYQVEHALDLAVVASAMLGAVAGFLWWNAAPAQIIMGDTGSLAVGAGMAGLALMTNTHLLLPIIGGLYVFETLSVIAQVISFRVFHRRVLRMAPIHHHFEVGGWPEFTVIVRFWLLAGLLVALGLGFFYADFIRIPGVLD
jgi:phospho-N-acetylmuramoyl-pentapeptide-transferase